MSSVIQEGDTKSILRFLTEEPEGFNDSFSHHRFMYNFKSLAELLKKAGFEDITECEKGMGLVPDIDKLDLRTGLFIEARKPVIFEGSSSK